VFLTVLTFLMVLMVCFIFFFMVKRFNDSFRRTIDLSTPLWSPIYRRPISITAKVVVNLENMEVQFPISYCESMGIIAQEARK